MRWKGRVVCVGYSLGGMRIGGFIKPKSEWMNRYRSVVLPAKGEPAQTSSCGLASVGFSDDGGPWLDRLLANGL
jgi:hypothetical protein